MTSETCTNLIEERRRRRSANPLWAMRYQLGHVMEELGLSACVIASEDGRVIAAPASLSGADAELLAALAPQASQPGARALVYEALCDAGLELPLDGGLHVEEFWAWDQPMLLVAAGELSKAHELSLARVILGLRRIARQTLVRATA